MGTGPAYGVDSMRPFERMSFRSRHNYVDPSWQCARPDGACSRVGERTLCHIQANRRRKGALLCVSVDDLFLSRRGQTMSEKK
jgi:hypothetical protein